MLKSLIAFCLSRRAIVVFGLLVFAGAGFFAFQEAQHRGLSEPHAGHPGNHRAGAGPLGRGDGALLHAFPSKSAFTRRPASTSSAPLRFMACPLSASSSSMAWIIILPTPRRRSRCNKTSPCRAIRFPTIQQNSGTGEIYPLPGGGSEAFRTDQSAHGPGLDRAAPAADHSRHRCTSTVGAAPTKEFEVEVDPHKLEAYNVTVPQILTALGNANINVGGREIRIGQQSINIRGVGLIDDGGNDDLTQGYKVDDIENVVLSQSNGVPVLVKDVAKVKVGYRAQAGHLRPGQGRRRRWRHRGDEPHGANRRDAAQGQGSNRQDEPRRQPAAGSQGGSLL